MRSTFFVLILAAACGGRDNSTPDASHSIDAPRSIDAAADASPDSSPDAMGSGSGSGSATARIWVVGDFATDGTTQAGWLTDADTLPATPTLVPAAPAVLPATTGYTQFVFDATSTKTAYVADVTTAGTFDLYAADADGANPTLLVAGQANVEIATITLSPDGTKVAFMMDSTALDNAYDVWVVNTAGTPVPILVSPARNVMAPDLTKLSAFTGSLTWSADSKWIGFSGAFNTTGHSQAYIVDTSAATPMATELYHDAEITGATAGVRGDLLFDANDHAYFRASPDGTSFSLFQWDGTNRNALALPARADNTTSVAGTFALTPDGASIVFEADAPTAATYNLYTSALATFAPTQIATTLTVNANSHPDHSAPLWVSPDGAWVAFNATYQATVNEPYVAKLDNSDAHRLVHYTVTNTRSRTLAWLPDSTTVYGAGNFDAANSRDAYRLDPTMTDQTPAKAVDAPTNGSIGNLLIRAK